MLRQKRHSKILELVNERHFVSLTDLMELTNSSESTIRADLVYLDKQGKIKRIRGGAESLIEDNIELDMEAKMAMNVEAKKEIARYAAQFVKEDILVYVDAGTSTFFLVDEIEVKNVTFVTNSMIIARKLKLKGYKVYLTGGEFKLTTDALIGLMTCQTIASFNFDIGFFGCNGVDIEAGLTTPDYEEAAVKKTAMEHSKKVYVLADHSKFGVKAGVKFHDFIPSEIITDEILDQRFMKKGIMTTK